jgi:NADPH:quinone reductase-like Zn-dependent oxidoreductase
MVQPRSAILVLFYGQAQRICSPMTEEKIIMKAIVVTDKAAGTAGMKLVERPEPQAAINDVVVRVHASGFTGDELTWPPTWTDRRGRDRTPSIPGHELAGVVTALGYGTTGLSVGQRVFGLTDWTRDGTLAEYVAVEARNLAPLPGDVDFTVGAALVMPGLTAWQGLFEHGRLQAGRSASVALRGEAEPCRFRPALLPHGPRGRR